jgi:hypothetical protein
MSLLLLLRKVLEIDLTNVGLDDSDGRLYGARGQLVKL